MRKRMVYVLTPADVERPGRWEAIRDDLDQLIASSRFEGHQERLQRGSANAEEDKDVDNQELIVSCHDSVMESGKRDDRVGFLGDKN